MTKEQFREVKSNLENYQFSSLAYTEYEEIAEYTIVLNDYDAIIIYGYNVETMIYEFHWACNNVQNLLKVLIKRNDNELVTFVPKEWVNDLELAGFHVNAVWKDYMSVDLEKYANDVEPTFLNVEDYAEASQVTISCIGQSRGFVGQSKDWMKQWIENRKPAVPDYAFNCVVLAKIEGEMQGIVCIGIYGEEDKKTLWIREIAVKPEVSGRGIGRLLLGQAFAYGIKQGAKRSFLLADECNENAIHLYKSIGFVADTEDGQIDMIRYV